MWSAIRPPGQLAASQIDHGGQVEIGPVGDGQVSDVADLAAVRLAGAEVAGQQVGEAPTGLVRDRGAHASTQPDPRQLMLAHHAGDPLVVYPLAGNCALVQIGSDPRCPVGAVAAVGRVLQDPDLRGQDRVRRSPRSPSRHGGEPRLER